MEKRPRNIMRAQESRVVLKAGKRLGHGKGKAPEPAARSAKGGLPQKVHLP